MRIDSKDLTRHLKKSWSPLYMIHGVEPLLALESLDLLIKVAKEKGYLSREIYVADSSFDWHSFLANSRSSSLFAAQKIIDLRLPSGKPGIIGAEVLNTLSLTPPEETIIIISLPKIDYRTQQSKWFDVIQKNGLLIQCHPIERAQLPQWIIERFQQQEQTITPASATFIAHQVEGNLLAAHQEIQKLTLLFPTGALTEDDIKNAIMDVSRFQIFDLMPTLYKRDLLQFERILYGLKAEAEALPLVLWALNEDIHLLLKALELKDQGLRFSEITRQLYLKPLQVQSYPALLERCSLQLITECIIDLHHIDTMIKGLQGGDPWHALANWGLKFVRGSRKT
ncbi:MAG: DNA polymerase III subunit delta [Ferrovum sp. 37-45-19]|uniref:DNA polymerase III subunit delta n=1 Tax=Ferrovum sp. JA12 TaxID=1356299 RepID=UPI000702CE56|nr:DNA polymerase III subunit delta [Ferrovum sp. JA12]OYV80499.1 MAG: DNA polymerase III subunit delta [Ferrovum sp. 21-44-67]OYV94814.1 MAG: DNA polymerase III subunit delta [Ferrovum sp. 37-45-19]HQT81059.1 DNA polymerase III subunit delta [Ferrovaceae bacterium]KRH79216.1 DNA polymerase III subunit delta [Ferrovum sp. JA12]HQU06124.1 DNA polymerase III subunit delta [Ferrovaceae bacterium]